MTGTGEDAELNQAAGSPVSSEPAFLVVGKLRRPHGLRGEILMEVITDFPERLRKGVKVYVGDEKSPMQIRSRRVHGQGLLMGLEGYSTPEEAGELRNQLVYVSAHDRPPLPEGEYYHHQLLGLRVITEEGLELGLLHEILSTAANDVYVVRPQPGAEGVPAEILLPAIESVIRNVNLERGEILIHLLPGLLPN
jgi:16S rRNA processing protein RimM